MAKAKKIPKVSVILTSYNHAAYIAAAIESVLNQTFTDFELLIIDDGSKDNSREIIKRFDDPRIKTFLYAENRGPVLAIRDAVNSARGKYIAVHHSDDLWALDKLDKQVKFLDANPNYAACFTLVEFVDERGDIDNIQSILAIDSVGAIVGGLFGASSQTTFVESASGAAAGARTGLSNLVIGALFIVFAFAAPVVGMVSSSATCGALTVVGYLMMTSIGDIDWSKIELAFPAFLTVIVIPFTYSITNGIGMGFISYVAIMIVQGKADKVKPLMWAASIAFLAMFIFT